jgi:NADPH:quinone reductase-like Zn-dependent oxidoreductase
MRAAVTEGFGGVERLVVRDVPKPVPGPGEVLVRVRAASMNPMDWKLREGQLRFLFRVKPPFVLGFDLAGEVEAVGPGVARLRPGDAVFGTTSRPGAHAEQAVAAEELLLPKPSRLSFEEAAAVPAAAASALQALRDEGRLLEGQRVLLNGAGGGIGTFAVQIAKARGARVTAVASAGKQDLLRQLGADECLDYAREDFTRREAAFDVVFDIVPNRKFPECRRALAPGGTYVTALPGPGPFLWRALTALPLFFGGRRCRALMLRPTRRDLEELARLAEAGTLRPVVAEVFGLDAIREAHRRMQSGHARGKIVVRP